MPDYRRMLSSIESFRRNEKYHEMFKLAGALFIQVATDESPESWATQSRVFYELHMALYQRAMKKIGRARDELLQRSRSLADRSAKDADAAGDPVGRLFAEMNIGGLILPALGKWQTGFEMSAIVCRKAQEIANDPSRSDEDVGRALQVAANTHFHRIRCLIACDKFSRRKEQVEALLDDVNKNTAFILSEDDYRSDIEAAQKFLRS